MSPKATNALGHIGFGVIILALVGAASLALTRDLHLSAWIAWAVQSAYWLGRERRDEEIHAGVNPFTQWWTHWNVIEWTADGKRDLLFPVVVNALVPLGLMAAR